MKIKIFSKPIFEADELELEINRFYKTIETNKGEIISTTVIPIKEFNQTTLVTTIIYKED